MLLDLTLLVVGLVLLVKASDVLVEASARLALVLRMTPVVIGVVVIGFGTSTPELLVSGLAAAEGLFNLGVGNIIGSNIANVLLVLGVAALVAPVHVELSVLRREVPLSLIAVVVFAWTIQGPLRVIDALLLTGLLVVTVGIVLALARRDGAALPDEVVGLQPGDVAVGRESVRALLGLAFTLAGAQMVVLGAGSIAERIGLAEGFVGLTIVAVGTSLPELAAAVQAARRGESGLLVGNLLGSNLFNATAVGAVVVWAGARVDEQVEATLAVPATLIMIASVAAVSLLLVVRRRILKLEGAALLVAYVAAVVLLAQ
jgi:cation:H+ antiporter